MDGFLDQPTHLATYYSSLQKLRGGLRSHHRVWWGFPSGVDVAVLIKERNPSGRIGIIRSHKLLANDLARHVADNEALNLARHAFDSISAVDARAMPPYPSKDGVDRIYGMAMRIRTNAGVWIRVPVRARISVRL